MRRQTLVLSLAAAALASPHAHRHVHRHAHAHAHAHGEVEKRAVVEEQVLVTVIQCKLDDRVLSEADCQQGIANGTLVWKADEDGSGDGPSTTTLLHTVPNPVPTPAPAAPAAASPASSSLVVVAAIHSPPPAQPAQAQAAPAPAPPPPSVAKPAQAAPPPPPPPAAQQPPPQNNKVQASSSAAFIDRHFPDGEIPCSQFPEQFGALRTDWLGLGGWAGVQKPNVHNAAGYDDIMTVTRSECTSTGCCLEGSFCSYACPEGYMKNQWPSVQGATGQSVGGLYCKNGFLHRSNPEETRLCSPGVNNVNVYVKNQLSRNVAICRTNYPGDENMSIPVDAQPGTVRKLTCPDQSAWKWLNKKTSAQYYINLPGYSVEQACRWGKQGDDFGNFAPGNLGVGWDQGRAWIAMFANWPTQTNVKIPYTIEIQGDNLSDRCRYRNGMYCSGANYERCEEKGCTISAASGNIYYVLTD